MKRRKRQQEPRTDQTPAAGLQIDIRGWRDLPPMLESLPGQLLLPGIEPPQQTLKSVQRAESRQLRLF